MVRVVYLLITVLIGVVAYAALGSFMSPGPAIFGAVWLTCAPVLTAIAWGERSDSQLRITSDPSANDGVPAE